MATKEEKAVEVVASDEKKSTAKPKIELIYVNPEKRRRAEALVALLSGSPKTQAEADKKTWWSAKVKEAGKDAEDVLQFIYVALGGLLRTREEQEAADKRAKKVRKNAAAAKKKREAAEEDDDE